jgi:hypothetical protein
MSDPASPLYLQEQIARIDRAMAEGHKFAAEQQKLTAEAAKYNRERWAPLLLAAAATLGALTGFLTILGKIMGWL